MAKAIINYAVIEGERFDFVDVSNEFNENMICCDVCALKNFCEYEDTPCSVFNQLGDRNNLAFKKHEAKNKN